MMRLLETSASGQDEVAAFLPALSLTTKYPWTYKRKKGKKGRPGKVERREWTDYKSWDLRKGIAWFPWDLDLPTCRQLKCSK